MLCSFTTDIRGVSIKKVVCQSCKNWEEIPVHDRASQENCYITTGRQSWHGSKMVLEPDDPRRISAVLAPVPPPHTHEIVAEQRSLFVTAESLQTANSSNDVTDDSNATIDYY